MSIKSKIATVAIAALAVATLAVGSASAKPKIHPVTGALIGAAVVGTAIAASTAPSYGYYPHRRHCWLEPRQNMFGQVFYVKMCRWH